MIGLAEMMNFPGVIAGDPHELDKLALATTPWTAMRPASSAKDLRHTRPQGSSPTTKCFTVEEGRERLARDVGAHP